MKAKSLGRDIAQQPAWVRDLLFAKNLVRETTKVAIRSGYVQKYPDRKTHPESIAYTVEMLSSFAERIQNVRAKRARAKRKMQVACRRPPEARGAILHALLAPTAS